ncbi:MAG: hypothetical protein FWD88_03295 [Treponema sp.]|nr:hypothetical protein [Treponema sp.]
MPKNAATLQWENPGFDTSRGAMLSEDASSWSGQLVAAQVLEEETDRVVRHLESALAATPGGEKPLGHATRKGLREKLHAYIERNYQGLLDRLSQDGDGTGIYAGWKTRHTPEGIGRLLDSMGGTDMFNTGEIEKSSSAKPWEHLEAHANGMLMRRHDAAAFVPDGNVCYVLGCVFRDNADKPKTVTDVKLSLNILELDLVPQTFRHWTAASYLIGEIVCGHLVKGIDVAARSRKAGGQNGEASALQGELAGWVLERCTETAIPTMDTRDLARSLAANAAMANVRRRGFDAALGMLVSILADCGLTYQFMENLGDGFDVTIREYEDTDVAALPDERYSMRLRYFDQARLDRERKAYDEAIGSLDARLRHFWDLLEVIYQDSKSVFRPNDFDDLARKNRRRIKKMHRNGAGIGSGDGSWNPVLSSGEKDDPDGMFRDILSIRDGMGIRLAQIRERMVTVCRFLNPGERRISEERLALLEKDYARIECTANPFRIQPGFLVDFEISSIKRKKTTLDSVSRALNVFLKGLPGLFAAAWD